MAKITLYTVSIEETETENYQVIFKTENYTGTKEFDSADGLPDNSKEIRDWLMGQIANNVDLIKRTLAKL